MLSVPTQNKCIVQQNYQLRGGCCCLRQVLFFDRTITAATLLPVLAVGPEKFVKLNTKKTNNAECYSLSHDA